MDICIRDRNTREWTSSVRPAMRDTYAQYKERPHYYRETPYLTPEYIVYRPDNNPYLPTYIARVEDIPVLNDGTGIGAGIGVGQRNNLANNITITTAINEQMVAIGHAIPIMDFADISVFITDQAVVGATGRANWFPARSYQAWAYRDFMYDPHRSIRKSYMSRGTFHIAYAGDDRILANQIVTIPIAGIDSNIVFTIGRNENGSVSFERNDAIGSSSRICDNAYARAGYLGFYTRITMDPGMIVIPPAAAAGAAASGAGADPMLLSTAHLSELEETDDTEHQCILCVHYRVNARFSPCEHQVCCSACYSQLLKNECPVCRAAITQVMNV